MVPPPIQVLILQERTVNLNDYKCYKCDKIEVDKEKPPKCCGEWMQKILVPLPVRWKTPGFTRTIPRNDDKKRGVK